MPPQFRMQTIKLNERLSARPRCGCDLAGEVIPTCPCSPRKRTACHLHGRSALPSCGYDLAAAIRCGHRPRTGQQPLPPSSRTNVPRRNGFGGVGPSLERSTRMRSGRPFSPEETT
uniref:(northern house mosquito) hypothetical protein n=1 Tax=Culex pipiens TaxID=7175 RepID=A0A8D8F5G9_CULPI